MKKITTFILVLISINQLNSQTIEKIVKNIEKVNIIQNETIGSTENKSENFINYELLKSKASIEELVKLTNHKNSVVNAYSTFALIEKSNKKFPEIFTKFLNNDKTANTRSGCIESEDKISSEIYHFYWNSLKQNERENDEILLKIDSITLYNKNSDWLLILRALENRIFPMKFNSQIEYLAFEKQNENAIFYLNNWYKAEYKEKLKKTFLDFLKNTNFKEEGNQKFYEIIVELFKFNDYLVNEEIKNKLKIEKDWINEKSKFENLLQKYGIYENLDK